ncbi:MAG: TIGR00159 family protein, partial [Deltaproteobacteria bacterium]
MLTLILTMDLSFFTRTNGLYVLVSAADILVVAYIIYRVLLLIRGTRAQQVLVGLGLIALGFFGSKLFGLRTLSWILDNFISSFVLIVIVVFQHDIRRGLSRVGKRPIFEALAYGQGAFLVDELTRGAE